MGAEDELRFRAAAAEPDEQESFRRDRRERGARDAGLERALDQVRRVVIEASELLCREGLKPARLVHVPRDAMSWPVFGHAFAGVRCGAGWHVVRGVVAGTDGRLWSRKQVHQPTPQKDLDAWRLEVEPPGGPLDLPRPVEYDGISLHTVRRISETEYTKVDLVDRLTDGYARLLFLHQVRRS